MVPTLLVIFTCVVLYWFPIRRWMSCWGATPSDLERIMAGDGLLVNPTYSGTMAVIVNAAPEHIWPWLVQIGYQRGGLYSYDWLDRLFGYLDRPSATRILPEFQNLAVGDKIPVGRGPSWPVAVIQPNRALVLDMRNVGGFDWVWQFGLYTIDESRTRLVSRSRVRTQTAWARLATYAIEPAGFLMTRRMLLGLKQRAEALRAARLHEVQAIRRTAASSPIMEVYKGDYTPDFSIAVQGVKGLCPAGEAYATRNIAEAKIPVLSCEGPCIRGEIARLAANLVANEVPSFARACHAETFFVPYSAMARWVTHAKQTIMIDGCFLKCHGRVLKTLIAEDKVVHIDALPLHKKYMDIFSMEDVPEEERKAVARQVADRIIANLKERHEPALRAERS